MRVRKDGVGVPELIYSLSSARNTHERDRPSGTAQEAAILRALRQVLDDEPKILADPLAARLLGDEFDRYKTVTRFFPWSARVRANFLMRSRYAEDCLAESLDERREALRPARRRLETFAFRQPAWASSLRIFEVDYPATQDWKRKKLEAATISIPDNVISFR